MWRASTTKTGALLKRMSVHRERCNECMQKHGKEIREQASQRIIEVMKPSEMSPQNSKEHVHAKHKEEEGDIFTKHVKAVHQWRCKHQGQIPRQTSEDANERFLAMFLHRQRHKLCKQELSENCVKQLSNIPGFACVQNDTDRNKKYLSLNNFVEKRTAHEQDNARWFPSRYSTNRDEQSLAIWVKNQRSTGMFAKSETTKERMALLQSVPGWTW